MSPYIHTQKGRTSQFIDRCQLLKLFPLDPPFSAIMPYYYNQINIS